MATSFLLFALIAVTAVLNAAGYVATPTGATRRSPAASRQPLWVKKSSSMQESQELARKVAKYVQARDIERIRQRGGSTEEIKAALINGTSFTRSTMETLAKNKGYQRFLGKGSLDQRLRAVIQYKREGLAGDTIADDTGLSRQEERELEEMMESDDMDDADGGTEVVEWAEMTDEEFMQENEEAVYEQVCARPLSLPLRRPSDVDVALPPNCASRPPRLSPPCS
jgi:hypothetical protein